MSYPLIKAFANTAYNGEFVNKIVVKHKNESDCAKNYEIEYFMPAYEEVRFDANLQKNVINNVPESKREKAEIIEIKSEGTEQEILVAPFNSRCSFSLRSEQYDFGNLTEYQLINEEVDEWKADKFTFEGTTIDYRLYVPAEVDYDVPLVMALHGSGETAERSNQDNRTHLASNRLGLSFSKDAWQSNYPCFVLMPQFPSIDESYSYEKYWKVYHALIESLKESYPIDSHRLYLATLSMGSRQGYKFLEFDPDYFAAALINCGNQTDTDLAKLTRIPIKVFHIEKDEAIPAECSKKVLQFMMEKGAADFSAYLFPNEFVKENHLTSAHNVWEYTMELDEMKEWLFSFKQEQRVPEKFEIAVKVSDEEVADFFVNESGILYLETSQLKNEFKEKLPADDSSMFEERMYKIYIKYDALTEFQNQAILVSVTSRP